LLVLALVLLLLVSIGLFVVAVAVGVVVQLVWLEEVSVLSVAGGRTRRGDRLEELE
jgi:hypothetical protein